MNLKRAKVRPSLSTLSAVVGKPQPGPGPLKLAQLSWAVALLAATPALSDIGRF